MGIIAAKNGELNIITDMDAAGARRLAAESDKRHAEGTALGPLDGFILAVKDNIQVEGMRWTAGVGAWRDRKADKDAWVVSRLRAAGAIPLAMVNMDEGALGATTANFHFGTTANPLSPDRTPGGSSGGSAAAVAAGMAEAALGSDTMGSVRIPAAYCGIAGLKPTNGLVPRTGLTYLSQTLDTIGPLAPDVACLAEMSAAMAGADASDPQSVPVPHGWNPKRAEFDTQRMRIGIPEQLAEVDCEPEILEGLEQAKLAIESIGCTVQPVDLAGWSPRRARLGGLLVVEVEGANELATALEIPGDGAVSPLLRKMLAHGTSASGERVAEARQRIRSAAAAVELAFSEVDALLMPTAPQRSFTRGSTVPSNQADLTALANFHGGPALAVPVPTEGLPASVQLVGKHFSEPHLLALGTRLETGLAAQL